VRNVIDTLNHRLRAIEAMTEHFLQFVYLHRSFSQARDFGFQRHGRYTTYSLMSRSFHPLTPTPASSPPKPRERCYTYSDKDHVRSTDSFLHHGVALFRSSATGVKARSKELESIYSQSAADSLVSTRDRHMSFPGHTETTRRSCFRPQKFSATLYEKQTRTL
jgi:hypothetical protein